MLQLKTLLKVSYLFSTAPYYNFETKQICKCKFYIFYSICTLLLIVTGFFYTSICINSTKSSDSSQSQQIGSLLETLSSLLLTLSALIAVSSAIFMTDKWKFLLVQLQHVDVKLGLWKNESMNYKRKICIKLFLVYALKLSKDVYCIFVYNWTGFGNMPKYFICNTIFEYYCFAPTLLMVLLAQIFRSKYKLLMELLQHQTNVVHSVNNLVITELFISRVTYGSYIRSTSKMFKQLNSILDNYNLIFGYQLLFMLGHTLLSVLQTFDYCLKYRQTTNDSADVLFANLCITGFNLVIINILFHKVSI